MSYKVRIPIFEGPFDLLVYLIETSKMDIRDIKIAQITEQYMTYINDMRNLDVSVASEFMVLAATLIEIKSKMMLPSSEPAGSGEGGEDPRSPLVEKILEYKKFKKLGEIFDKRHDTYKGIFEKPKEDISAYLENPDEYLDLDLSQFAKAFEIFLEKKQKVEDVKRRYVKVKRNRATIEERMIYIDNKFKALGAGEKISMEKLIPNCSDPYDIVVTFVSLLQMARDGFAKLEQTATYGEIFAMPHGEKRI